MQVSKKNKTTRQAPSVFTAKLIGATWSSDGEPATLTIEDAMGERGIIVQPYLFPMLGGAVDALRQADKTVSSALR